ncbi:hypothetical protein C8R46DRAFT_1222633 [Mycena filopes]|nr:hypothetical protein C8R46DRAFT_1222633 [Mycena filopes]
MSKTQDPQNLGSSALRLNGPSGVLLGDTTAQYLVKPAAKMAVEPHEDACIHAAELSCPPTSNGAMSPAHFRHGPPGVAAIALLVPLADAVCVQPEQDGNTPAATVSAAQRWRAAAMYRRALDRAHGTGDRIPRAEALAYAAPTEGGLSLVSALAAAFATGGPASLPGSTRAPPIKFGEGLASCVHVRNTVSSAAPSSLVLSAAPEFGRVDSGCYFPRALPRITGRPGSLPGGIVTLTPTVLVVLVFSVHLLVLLVVGLAYLSSKSLWVPFKLLRQVESCILAPSVRCAGAPRCKSSRVSQLPLSNEVYRLVTASEQAPTDSGSNAAAARGGAVTGWQRGANTSGASTRGGGSGPAQRRAIGRRATLHAASSNRTRSRVRTTDEIKIAYWNIFHHLTLKLTSPEFHTILEEYDVMLFAETDMLPGEDESADVPRGYVLVSLPRKPRLHETRRGGAVALLIRENIQFTQSPLSSPDILVLDLDFMWLIGAYIPPTTSRWEAQKRVEVNVLFGSASPSISDSAERRLNDAVTNRL